MRIKVSRSKNSTSYFVIKDIYRNNKRTTKVVESLGNHEEILKKHPGIDPYTWAKEYAKKLTLEEKENNHKIIAKYNPDKQIERDKQTLFNTGYLFLQSIYHELKLDKVCQEISQKYEFEYDLNEILTRLLYLRVLHPTSKKGTFEHAKDLLEPAHFQTHQIYRALNVLEEQSDFIEEKVYKNSLNVVGRNTQVLYYDCTNFFFEIEEEDSLREYGVSKENRPNPIVQMGLFMDGSGLPLAFSMNPGSANEQPTLKPLEKRILKDFNLSKFVVCTDAGLSSNGNRIYNTYGERAFVTTQSIKKLKKFLKEWALDPEGWRIPGSNKKINLNDIRQLENDKRTYYKERWIKENDLEQKLIVTYSPVYERYQSSIREKQIERAIKKIEKPASLNKPHQNDPKRFIKSTHVTDDGEIADKAQVVLNQEQIEKESMYDGFYAVCTNLESPIEEVIKINQGRWEIEETFRILKSEFRTRPVYLQRESRIKAHFLTCFLSLLMYRILEKKVDERFTCPELVSTLRNMNMRELDGEGYIPAFTRTEITDALHDAFGFRTDFEIVTQKNMKKILKQTKKGK
ncbi:IS1634 family transposase [Lentibacillus daqui]|uniref:IS1634 family transposase n=1 Tax=Lentibacillus daqui TaxID=2911514 RepID=UPI0022B183A7|nr:transposase [Lentibacillus daqui]